VFFRMRGPSGGRIAAAAVTMEHEGDLVIPRLGSEVFLDKPPLVYWGITPGIRIFASNEFSARFFTGLCYARRLDRRQNRGRRV
jgi:4-amino-4-deoxy-L-arabinose transferase-like glycosyltransferase